MRVIRDVLVEAVFAGALTSLVLGYGLVGVVLLALGAIMLSLALRGHRYMTFGASRKLSTINL
ncbi:MAG TPA: hypothetical protein VGH76_17360 [Actinomycetospora sp.]|uniref:hypothetical protein n=1 Tax=Actinomycetospora sp. TaxID=1872135 RepID=UPI002F423A14